MASSMPELARSIRRVIFNSSLTMAKHVALADGTITIDSDLLGRINLPRAEVVAVLWHPPHDITMRDQWVRKLLTDDGPGDRVSLENGDELRGSITAISGDTISLETDTGNVAIETRRSSAVRFAKSQSESLEGLRVMVGLSDGSRWLASSLKSDGKKVELTCPGLATLTVGLDKVVALRPFGGRSIYLSDLKPSGYKHIPYLQLAWPYEWSSIY
jgi:hypothetical protein